MASNANMSDPAVVAAMQAQMAAVASFNIEAFTLMVIAIIATSLRTYSRITTVGFSNLQADDYLVWVGTIAQCFETGLAYSVGEHAHGLANDAMTTAQRAALSPGDPEYQMRVLGSKIQLWGWSTYSIILWSLKASMCTFFLRLTDGLTMFKMRIYFGFAFIVCSWVTVAITLLASCRPFHHYWQINPDPGAYCHPAVSPAIVWTFLSMNVSTDLYLISIPLPILFSANVSWPKRLALGGVFCCGLFVTGAAISRVALMVTDKQNGAFLAGSWAVRETFVAVITTNMPMLFPLFRRWMSPCLGRIGSTIDSRRYNNNNDGKSSSAAGGGGMGSSSRRNRTPLETVGKQRFRRQPNQSLNHITNLSATYANDSEERIYELRNGANTGVKGAAMATTAGGVVDDDKNGVLVLGEDRDSELSLVAAGGGIQRRVDVVVEEEKHDDPRGEHGEPVLGGNFVAVSSGANGRNRSDTNESSRSPGGLRSNYFADHVKSENYKWI